ncbi:MAG TPA: branched-chain amino acid ABC transporter substrate-binding protein [Acidimicrobiales bacterium]|nr:branched-chain amino acid ABC transporter substrate-binding protein [Acidimicrobiales bacterium]
MRRLALLVVVLVTAAACGDGGDGRQSPPVAKIGVIVPLDAGLVDFGKGIRNSVQLAVDEANRRDVIPGWRLELVALDDSSDPGVGESAARRMAGDPSAIGVVGTYNSGVATRVAPVLGHAGVAMVSPANTDPALTMGTDVGQPQRPYGNYFRMIASDSLQGRFLAGYALSDLGVRRAAVVSETKAVSKGLADVFGSAFTGGGGTVVRQTVVPDGTTDFGEVVRTIASLRPDLLFFGGEYLVGAQLRRDAVSAGLRVPVMGGDGIKDPSYIARAGPASEGDLASTVGTPLESLTSARPFVDAYTAAGFAEPATDYGPYAYDAANVLIAAAAPALRGKDSVTPEVRREVVSGVQSTDLAGSSGRVAFDEFGDSRTKVFTLYKVEAGAWKPEKTQTLS